MFRPCQVLPSYLKRKGSGSSCKSKKTAKAITTWDRDIVLLPNDYKEGENYIPYPRGKSRSRLGRLGLMGKVHLSSDMSVEEVECEIRSVFKTPMGNDTAFPFKYLQASGGGSRCLAVPSVSSSFRWTAQQVAKIGNQRNTIYIMAERELAVCDDVSKTGVHYNSFLSVLPFLKRYLM